MCCNFHFFYFADTVVMNNYVSASQRFTNNVIEFELNILTTRYKKT